ncbi:prepilin peptidase [Carnobacterium sp. TMP28]|uniref:prepilin peptidase n=1 Tax=Carnobacterium sp. TMP28 TaxID=3397060 RepID=UPI0039E0DE86
MENLLLLFFIWLIGTCFGSFFIVIGLRIPIGQSIIYPRSSCSKCYHVLNPFDLIPIFSYFLLKGHCRHCHISFSFLYPLTEALTGLLFVLIFYQFSNQPIECFSLLFLLSFGIIFCISDSFYFLLPDSLMLLFFLFTLFFRLWFHPLSLAYYLISSFSIFLLFYIFYCLTDEGLGGGDVKLFGILGLFFGYELTLFILFIACLISLVVGLALFTLKNFSIKTHFPFAPAIFLASFIVALYGEKFQAILYSIL